MAAIDASASARPSPLASDSSHSPPSSPARDLKELNLSASAERPTLFVRALYDYRAEDPMFLEFAKDDIIAVILQLDTGWWDGTVHDRRGWFPSNYCESIDARDLTAEMVAACQLSEDDDEDDDEEDSEKLDEPQSPSTATFRPHSPQPADSRAFWSGRHSTDFRISDELARSHGRGLTWDDLQAAVVASVECLLDALRAARKADYRTHIDSIIDCLSATMTAAGFPGFSVSQSDTQFHGPFRQLMISLGRLQLAAEMALITDSAGESGCERECERVVAAIAKFVAAARRKGIEPVGRLDPGFIDQNLIDGNGTLSQAPSPLSSAGFNSSFDNFWGGGQQGREDASILIALDDQFLETADSQWSTIVNVTRDLLRFLEQPYARASDEAVLVEKSMRAMDLARVFLALLESVDLSSLSKPLSPTVVDFRAKKQVLYDSISSFLIEVQNITLVTDPAPSLARLERVRSAVKEVDTSVQVMTLTLQMLVEEKDLREQRGPDAVMAPQPIADSRRPSAASTHSDGSLLDYLNDYGDHHSSSSSTPAGSIASGSINKSEQKIQKFFGHKPPYQVTVGYDGEVPSFLSNEYEDELVYDAKGHVKGGSLNGLIERLTRHDFLDTSFNTTFLLTYRSFTTARIFFEMLIERFTIQPPPDLTEEEFEIWVARKQKPIRLRVFNILKIWLEQYWDDGQDESEEESVMSREILNSLTAFSAQLVQQRFPGANALAKVIRQRQQGHDVSKRLILNLGGSVPQPILPKRGLKDLKVTHIDALEFARQLTILESQLYGRIRPLECLNRAWSTKRGGSALSGGGSSDGVPPAENIKRLIVYSNQLTNWTAQCVLTQSDLKKRVNVIKHLISIADKCRQLNNFSSMTAVISALYSATIHRLNRTWEQVPHRSQVMLDNLNSLMNSTRNFGEYRAMLHLVNPPCVPFFGVYLTDLTFIEDGNTDMLLRQADDKPMINFSKRAKSAEVIREIQQYQSVPYALKPVPALQDMIREGLAEAPEIEQMYELSLSIEPRERGDDEKISRLLQDSGFL